MAVVYQEDKEGETPFALFLRSAFLRASRKMIAAYPSRRGQVAAPESLTQKAINV